MSPEPGCSSSSSCAASAHPRVHRTPDLLRNSEHLRKPQSMETNHDLRCPEHVLYLHHWDERYERAAVRWLGRLLAERPALGLGRAAEAADSPAISSAHGQFLAT